MKKFFKIESDGLIKEAKIEKEKIKKGFNFKEFQYLGVGFYLIIPILLGLLIGLLTKKIAFFIFLGAILTFYNLFQITKK